MQAMRSKLIRSLEALAIDSKSTLIEYLSDRIGCVRFFSYGSNMNEGKIREDTRRNGFEFGLRNVRKGILQGYKRTLGNVSKNHGLAFTIVRSETEQVEGICHDVPFGGLNSFLRKEGLLSDEPSYKLIMVSVSGQKHPILTLKGLKPSSLDKLDCRERLKAYCYVSMTIEGAKRWNVNHSDILQIRNRLARELRGRTCKDQT